MELYAVKLKLKAVAVLLRVMAFCWELLKVNGSVVKNDDRHIDGIDGLRGLAIVGITDFHIVGEDVPGGYMGVVLSFLLTGFLFRFYYC